MTSHSTADLQRYLEGNSTQKKKSSTFTLKRYTRKNNPLT
jgi:hypothetical protein